MQTIGNWLAGGSAAVIGLLGLFMSSHAKDGFIYGIGLVVAVACVLFIMNTIMHATGKAEG